MRVAVDAMGGDHAPGEIVAGAVAAARDLKSVSQIVLVGDEKTIRAELARHGRIPSGIEVLHASETIGMAEMPVLAVRKKKDSSISRAIDLVKKGDVQAMVSAGNTGAVVVAASLKLRNLELVRRPAIATALPTLSRPLVLIDAGATVDCDPNLLCQFAVMGSVYSREIFGNPVPVVGLLSIGGEETKGNDVTKDAFRLLSKSNLRFRGNVEGHDMFEGETDVVVCDGFLGNVVLKTAESAARTITSILKREFTKTSVRCLGSFLLRGAIRGIKNTMDPELYGGAPLLGVTGTCIITHGASTWRAIYHAIRVAGDSLRHRLNDLIVEEIRKNGF